MANKLFHYNNRLNCSKTKHWHLACPLQTAECVCVQHIHRAREVIWYNNMKGLEGREFNDECAFTEPWLRLWAWNCPRAVEQQPGLSIGTSPTWSVESGWINGIGVWVFFFSWEHSFQTENEATHSLRKRRCGLGWLANIDRQPERLRGTGTTVVAWGAVPKTKTNSKGTFTSLALASVSQCSAAPRLVMSSV